MNVGRTFGAVLVPIDSVEPHPDNYREHDVGAISESIRRFGQTKPVVVQDGTNYIVAGSGTWKAMVALGHAEIGVHFEPWNDAEARAYLIADNWIAGRGRTLSPELLELLRSLQGEDELLQAAGIEDGDMADLERMAADEQSPLDLSKSPKPKKPIECPSCGHSFTPKATRSRS